VTTMAAKRLFAEDAAIKHVFGESILLLGGGRALLMQLAHPSVAKGVAEHSNYKAEPLARLQRTIEAMNTIVFGTEDDALQMAAVLRAVHNRVTGDGYHANDPALLFWVHATLVDTALRMHARFLRPIKGDELASFYGESMRLAEVLGVPRDEQPEDAESFRSYIRATVASCEVSDEARDVAKIVISPRVPTPTQPLALLARQLTTGLLPAPLRRGYRLAWDPAREAAFNAACLATRQWLPRLPPQLRGGYPA
jgi:uncharacterized protein (DUF2236 family)